MVIVLQWYFNERESRAILPELSSVFGPFPDRETANQWAEIADKWGGWGRYEYQVEDLHTPTKPDDS